MNTAILNLSSIQTSFADAVDIRVTFETLPWCPLQGPSCKWIAARY
jgi:hypothetical protein